MDLKTQKKLAAAVLGCSPKKIRFDTEKLDEIKESITKADIKNLIANNVIIRLPARGVSRGRAKKIAIQKAKGKRKGHGSRKGKKGARTNRKREWINKVRLQRRFIKELKEQGSLSKKVNQMIYMKIKGGFFRSKKHLKLYLNEHNLIENKA